MIHSRNCQLAGKRLSWQLSWHISHDRLNHSQAPLFSRGIESDHHLNHYLLPPSLKHLLCWYLLSEPLGVLTLQTGRICTACE